MHQPNTLIEAALDLESDNRLGQRLRRAGVGTLSDLRIHLLKNGLKSFLRETHVSASTLRHALGGRLNDSLWPYRLFQGWNFLCTFLLIMQFALVFLYFRDVIGANGLYRLILPMIVVSSVAFAAMHQAITQHFNLSFSQYTLSACVFAAGLATNTFSEPIQKWLSERPTMPTISNTAGFFSIGDLITRTKVTYGNGTFLIPSDELNVKVEDKLHTFSPDREILLPVVEQLKRKKFHSTGQTFDPGSTVAVSQANKERRPDGTWQYNFTFRRSDRVRYWAVHDASVLAQSDKRLQPFKTLVDSLNQAEGLVFEASTAFGVYVLVRTKDGVLIVSRRDQSAHIKRSIWTASVNHGMDFERDCVVQSHHRNPILNAMYAGLINELGIPQAEVSQLSVLAIGYDQFHHYGAVGIAYCRMTSDEIKDRIAARSPAEIGKLDVLPIRPEKAIEKMLSLGKWDDGAIINIVLVLIYENHMQGLDVSRRLRRAGIGKLRRVGT